jgi:mannose-6-phosphate isomerase-like protein (cupin superfamily)
MPMGTFRQVTTVASLILFIGCNQSKNDFKDTKKLISDTLQPGIFYYSRHQVDSILSATSGDNSSVQSLGTGVILEKGPGGEPYYISKRTVDGYVEIHEQYDDVVVISSGHGRLRTGRKVDGSKLLNGEKPWRNWYGGEILDVSEMRISPGDFIVIPAMTGHQYIPDKNDSLIYWTIKIKRLK